MSDSVQKSVVAIQRVRGDVRAAVRAALDMAEWTRVIPRGADVSLKVNLGWDLFIPGSITSPLVAEALIEAIRDHVGRIYMVESDQVLEDIERAMRHSGMGRVCRRTGAEWVNMSRGPTVAVDAPDNVVLKRIHVPRILRETLMITVPVMKTHAKTRITGALKNQWGCLDTMRHEHHLVLDDALADLNSVIRPALALMDATVGLEGNGPKSGRPRVADRILCSADPVALDTAAALTMGVDPASVTHLARCAARGLGTNDPGRIEFRGENPADEPVRFAPARHNAVSHVETLLRQSTLKRLFFNTPIFKFCLVGAKTYYQLWTALYAKRYWAQIRAHPVYGPQWRLAGPQGAHGPERLHYETVEVPAHPRDRTPPQPSPEEPVGQLVFCDDVSNNIALSDSGPGLASGVRTEIAGCPTGSEYRGGGRRRPPCDNSTVAHGRGSDYEPLPHARGSDYEPLPHGPHGRGSDAAGADASGADAADAIAPLDTSLARGSTPARGPGPV